MKNFTPTHVRDLRVGDQLKVSGTETYSTITALIPHHYADATYIHTADGRHPLRGNNAMVKKLAQ